jgi:hypothetical protein
MQTSEQVNEIFAALSAAQGKLKPALKTAINDAFKRNGKGSAYATLNDCVETANPTLSEHGLCIIQGINGTEFIARVGHKSGQWYQTSVPIPGDITKMTIQQLIAIQTYLRRATYSLVGLSFDDDDDGNEAAKAGTFRGTPAPAGWDHKPIGDVTVNADAQKYAEAFIKALDGGDVRAVHNDLTSEGEELYRATWSLLDSKTRSTIKKLLAEKAAA